MILLAFTKCLSSLDYQVLITKVDKYHCPHFTDRKIKLQQGSVSSLIIQQVGDRAGDRHPAFLPVPVLPTGSHWISGR